MKKARDFLRKVIIIVKRPAMQILPGQLAFFIVVSLIPLVALVGAIGSSFGLSTTTIKSMLENSVPEAVVTMLISNQTVQGLNFNIIVFFVAAFILASNGAYSMINTSNQIYKIERSSEIKRRAKAILMTFILVCLFLFLLLVPAFGDTLLATLSITLQNKQLYHMIELIYRLCQYPLSLLLLYYNIKLLYTLAPDQDISSKSTIPGALFTTVMWLLSSKIYAFYIKFFSHYDIFYGSMSNILVLLFWVYILAYIFILGMCFNATSIIKEIEDKENKEK